MTVQEILTIAKLRLQHLSIGKDEDVLINLINIGVGELCNRFNLAIKSETVPVNPNLALYELRNEDVQQILTIYDPAGKELAQSNVLNSTEYDYKLVNYRSFVLRKPNYGHVYVLYKASPIPVKDANDIVDLPSSMMDALVSYIAYLGQSTINRDNVNEAGFCYQRYLEACNALDMQGYKIPLNTETYSVQSKGFV